jgi:tetratricopeptide (TPR) repeat protein
MADKKTVNEMTSDAVITKAKDFWGKYGKILSIASIAVILLAGGWYVYNNFVKKPKETKAADVIFKAEEYFRMDSVNLALNGDGLNWGFLKVANKYSGTDAGNMANYYAGACYSKLNENDKAITYLKKFSTSSKPLQARAYKLMADAYGDLGKNKEAFDYYKKAGHYFEADAANSADALFMAAYLAHKSLNDAKGATELYKEIKEKYQGAKDNQVVNLILAQTDIYLGQLGEYNTNN